MVDIMMNCEKSPNQIGDGILGLTKEDSDGQLSSEEENLIAESTSAINNLFGRFRMGENSRMSRVILSQDLDDDDEEIK